MKQWRDGAVTDSGSDWVISDPFSNSLHSHSRTDSLIELVDNQSRKENIEFKPGLCGSVSVRLS